MKIPRKYIKYLHVSRLARFEHERIWLVQDFQAGLRHAKDVDAQQSVLDEMHMELDLHDEEVSVYLTNKWAAKARRLMIPIPVRYGDDGRETPFWDQGKYTGDWYLTNRGLAMLRSDIRQEYKERNERWNPIISMIVGGIGSLTGLISVIAGLYK